MIDKMENLILAKLGKPYTRTGANFIMTSCFNPKHNDKHPSFAINLVTGAGKCFGCGFTINSNYWTNDLPDEEEEELLRAIEYQKMRSKLFVEDLDSKDTANIFLPPIDEKLTKYRGLTKDTLEKMGIYITNTGRFANRVIFPIYYADKLMGFTGRATKAEVTPKYLHSTGLKTKNIIYPYNIIKGNKRLYITEGVMDALSLINDGYISMCNFGVADNFNLKKVAELVRLGVEEIYLFFDKDNVGQEAEIEILQNPALQYFDKVGLARMLPEFKEYYESSAKDYNEYMVLKQLGCAMSPIQEPQDPFAYLNEAH